MSKSFVAFNDPVHGLLRQVTRSAALRIDPAPGRGTPRLQHLVRPEALPEAYFSLAVFHSLQGLPLVHARLTGSSIPRQARMALPELVSYFDSVRLDLRCCRDMRLKVAAEGPGLLAAELLSFGTGMLRARNDDQAERVHRHIWSEYGRLYSRYEVVYARIRALHRRSVPVPEELGKESFDSTNVIFGDTFGELEQLWERRADTVFLDQVAHSLAERAHCEIVTFCHPPLVPMAIMDLHFRAQGLWKAPPANAKALLRRLDYILSHTTVDNTPQTVYQWRRTQAAMQARPPRPFSSGWAPDDSGYDGWLPEEGPGGK